MQTSTSLAPGTTIAIVGAGRLGRVLARALRATELEVLGPIARNEGIPDADVVLLCVPDAAIAEVSVRARPHARFLGHVSGATPLTDVDFSLHPLQTFTGSEPAEFFHGVGAAIAGRTPAAHEVAEHLAGSLGARPFDIADAHRARYHAAASFASNFVLTVLDSAEQLAAAADIPHDHARGILAPLVRQTVENWVTSGAAAVLTGPIARGDEGTIARQRAAAEEIDLPELFDALTAATRTIAARPAAPRRETDSPEEAHP